MTDLTKDMVAAGYQRTGSAQEWTATGPGQPVPCSDLTGDLHFDVLHDRIRVYRKQFFGERGTVRSWFDTPTVAVFASVEEFLEWCREHGSLSLPGLPPFAQGID